MHKLFDLVKKMILIYKLYIIYLLFLIGGGKEKQRQGDNPSI